MKSLYLNKEKDEGFVRSKWLKVRTDYNVSKRNSLYYYREDSNGYREYDKDFNQEDETFVDYFIYKGGKYAISRFYALGSAFISEKPFEVKNYRGEKGYIQAVDMDGDLYDPLYVEFDEYGENVRVYKKCFNFSIDNEKQWYYYL